MGVQGRRGTRRPDLCRGAARSAALGRARRPPCLEFIVRSSPGRPGSRTTPPATGAGRTEANRSDQVAVFHHPERTVLTPLRISDSDPEHLTTLAPSIHCWHARPLGASAVFAMAPWLLRSARGCHGLRHGRRRLGRDTARDIRLTCRRHSRGGLSPDGADLDIMYARLLALDTQASGWNDPGAPEGSSGSGGLLALLACSTGLAAVGPRRSLTVAGSAGGPRRRRFL